MHTLLITPVPDHGTAKAACTCGWQGTEMKGPQAEDAAALQWESHLRNSETTPRRSPEAEEAQQELAQQKAWQAASNDNALAAQRAEVRRVHSQATLRNAAAWALILTWALAALYVLLVLA